MTRTELRQFKDKHKLQVKELAFICRTPLSTVCNWLYGNSPLKLKPIYEKALKDWEKNKLAERMIEKKEWCAKKVEKE